MKFLFEEYGEFIEGIIAAVLGLGIFYTFFIYKDGLLYQDIVKFISYYL